MAKNIGWWRDSNQGSLVLEATALPLTTVHGYFLGWFQIQHLNDLNESRMNLNWIKNAFLYSVVYFSEWILRWKALVGNFTALGTLTSHDQTNDWKAFWKVCFLPFVVVVVVVGCCKVWPMVLDAIKHNLGRCLPLTDTTSTGANVINIIKGWFTLDAAVCVFRSGLCQHRDRKFSISLRKRNCLPQTHAENAVMWMTLKSNVAKLCWNIDVWLDDLSPLTSFNQLEGFISAYQSYSTLKFVFKHN